MSDVRVIHADCRDAIREMPDCSVASVVTDPPYSLVSIQKRFGKPGSAPAQHGRDGLYRRAAAGFMGQQWDTGETAFDPTFWAEVLRVLRPGGHLVAFGGTRTYHRLACAIEDAGFEIRDQIGWLFGSGFPKSLDVSKGLDRAAGAERQAIGRKTAPRYSSPATATSGSPMGNISPRANGAANYAKAAIVTAPATDAARQWEGWGTALKPAWESIVLAQKPHDLSQLCDIMARKIMEALCQLPSLAKDAAESSLLSRSVFGEAFDSAQWSAVAGCNTPADLFALTATWPCEWAIPSSLSIALSWLDILGASLSLGSTFTTETNASLTTDLKTLNSLLSKSTAAIIIEVATGPGGTGSSASLAARIFSAVSERLRITQELSVIGAATSKAGSAGLRPNWEPICLARKPLIGTVAENVLQHGCGALNIDGCRVEAMAGDYDHPGNELEHTRRGAKDWRMPDQQAKPNALGRWPANVIHDGSEEVLAAFPTTASGSGAIKRESAAGTQGNALGRESRPAGTPMLCHGDAGSAARFFYTSKADAADRLGSKHPTVKPVDLMAYLVRLITPPKVMVMVCESCDNAPHEDKKLQAVQRPRNQSTPDSEVLLAGVSGEKLRDPSNAVPGVREAGVEGATDSLFRGVSGHDGTSTEDPVPPPVRALRKDIQADEGRSETVLQSPVCGERERPGETKRETHDDPRILNALPSGPPNGHQGGLCDGAPPPHGREPGAPVGRVRSRASHQREQGRQQPPEPDGDDKGSSRSDAEATKEDGDRLSALRGSDQTQQRCPICGSSLKKVIRAGVVLDPFAGSGTTGMASLREGFDCILIEREAQYVADINARLQHVRGGDTPLFTSPAPVLGDAA